MSAALHAFPRGESIHLLPNSQNGLLQALLNCRRKNLPATNQLRNMLGFETELVSNTLEHGGQ
jgi:hypothetical protein